MPPIVGVLQDGIGENRERCRDESRREQAKNELDALNLFSRRCRRDVCLCHSSGEAHPLSRWRSL
jgi:hypothetical protein